MKEDILKTLRAKPLATKEKTKKAPMIGAFLILCTTIAVAFLFIQTKYNTNAPLIVEGNNHGSIVHGNVDTINQTNIEISNEIKESLSKEESLLIKETVADIVSKIHIKTGESKGKIRHKVYKELKDRYDVKSYKDIPKVKFEEALIFLKKKSDSSELIDIKDITLKINKIYQKRVAASEEASGKYSNQREFAQLSSIQDVLGKAKKKYNVNYIYFSDEGIRSTYGKITWYNARKKSKDYRLYYPKNEVTSLFKRDDLMILGIDKNKTLYLMIAEKESQSEGQLQAIFNSNNEKKTYKSNASSTLIAYAQRL